MTTRNVRVTNDDLDGSKIDDSKEANYRATVFTVDGTSYEIDLSPANKAKMQAAFAPYIAVARRTGGKPTKKAGKKTGGSAKIRQWAMDHGFTVSTHGRIPREVRKAYEDAHGHTH